MINSRSKGKRGELEVVHILRAHGWTKAGRTSDGRTQSARGDIQHGPEACHIEVKLAEKLSVPAALDQLERDSDPLDMPVLIHRPSRHGWMATIALEDLLPLLALRERG